MNSLTGILTAAAIAMHSILGCCAHAAHEGPTAGGEHQQHGCDREHTHHHEPCVAEADSTANSSHHGIEIVSFRHDDSHNCNHARCTWHAPEVWGSGWVDSLTHALVLPAWSETLGSFSSIQTVLPSIRHGCESITLPVRSHLLKSVLLI